MKVGIAITQDFYLAGEIRILVFNMLLDTRSKHILVLNTGSLLIIGLKIKNRWQNLMKFLPIQMSLWWQEGMEISIEKYFWLRRWWSTSATSKEILVTATQMLGVHDQVPTADSSRNHIYCKCCSWLNGLCNVQWETVLRGYPDLAVCTMATICIESESTIDYGIVFKRITENAPVPISPLESLVLLQFEQLKRLCFWS